ncbi:MAG: RagB/SusD family nutrient uptake outer membrane protein, partial [Saprospiraceae bacterium]
MKNNKNIQSFLAVLVLLFSGLDCRKLDPEVYDKISSLGKDSDQIHAAIASVYAGLRDYAPANSPYILNEGSSDEIVVPIRGGDWFDNGTWENMWKHSWKP